MVCKSYLNKTVGFFLSYLGWRKGKEQTFLLLECWVASSMRGYSILKLWLKYIYGGRERLWPRRTKPKDSTRWERAVGRRETQNAGIQNLLPLLPGFPSLEMGFHHSLPPPLPCQDTSSRAAITSKYLSWVPGYFSFPWQGRHPQWWCQEVTLGNWETVTKQRKIWAIDLLKVFFFFFNLSYKGPQTT